VAGLKQIGPQNPKDFPKLSSCIGRNGEVSASTGNSGKKHKLPRYQSRERNAGFSGSGRTQA